MSYVIHTRDGSYCSVCGEILGQEEADFECCDACGGEGLGGEDDDGDDDSFDGVEPSPAKGADR